MEKFDFDVANGFPRSCGDIPCSIMEEYAPAWFPPFMRGYTPESSPYA